MFTGIITHLGKLTKKKAAVFTFSADQDFCRKIKKGTSIAINGVCLTTLNKTSFLLRNKPIRTHFSIEIMPETQNKTMLMFLKIGDLVNLELPVTPQTFLSGHIVQGHIDDISKLLNIKIQGNSRILKFSTSPAFSKYIVPKGSIAINGISLTVIEARKDCFTVGIISYTWNNTMLHTMKIGSFTNIEVDILAKYLEKLTEK